MLYILGDIHGLLHQIKKIINTDDGKFDIIQVGDFGIGYSDVMITNLKEINEILKERNCHLYIMRGNHDNPNYFNGNINLEFSNVKLVRDYDFLNIGGYDILFVGGALSIDRASRTVGYDYWLDEKFGYDGNKIKNIQPQIVITHNCPSFSPPIGVNSNAVNERIKMEMYLGRDLRKELIDERNSISSLYRNLDKSKLKKWFYGHFHLSYRSEYENIKFYGLAIDEIFPIEEYQEWMEYE